MKTLLSTKILSPSQKELLLNSGLGLVEYNALDIETLEVEIPLEPKNLIFTSQNAVRPFLERTRGMDRSPFRTFCVGEKTARLLEAHGLGPVKACDYAAQLGPYLVEHHRDLEFLFFCGRQRRELLPRLFEKHNIRFREVVLYDAHPSPRAFEREFDGILCFSPQGIKSHLMKNTLDNSMLFCIGETTAEEAQKHSVHISIATRPTVENVLVKAINHFRHD